MWGSHPSALILLFNAVISPKIDYGFFFFASVLPPTENKLNALLCTCLRTVVGEIQSTFLASLEMECSCLPLDIRSHWLAGKCLFKIMGTPNSLLYEILSDIKSFWKYIPITLLILTSISFSFTPLNPIIYRSSLRF